MTWPWTALKWLLVAVGAYGFLVLAGSLLGPVAGLVLAVPLMVLAGAIQLAIRRSKRRAAPPVL